jgi:glycosyltransferase involved in cell wall biosynthesis
VPPKHRPLPLKIAWLSATQPPFREPMWREIAALAELDVSIMFAEERTRHFVWTPKADYRSSVVPTRALPLPSAVSRRFDETPVVLAPGQARRILRGADALVIHVWWQPANLWAALRARMRRVPYLIFAESTLESRQFAGGPAARVRSLVFRHAGAVIVPGPAAAAAAIADGAAPERVVESGNSVDLDLFDERVRKLRTARAAEPGRPHRFVVVGQLIERKNVGPLIRALAELDDQSTLDVAGDGVQFDALRDLARQLGVGRRVRFLGFRSPEQVLELLAESHTLVLPSTEEVYGYTALEAYVAGLQVVVSTKAGVASSLEGRPGTWMAEPDMDALRRAMGDAVDAWTGWREGDDVEFASPRRVARDVLRAVEIARG